VNQGVVLGFALSAFGTWEQSAAPTSKNANESKTASLVECMNPPQELVGLGTRTRDAGILTSDARVWVKRKKQQNRGRSGWNSNHRKQRAEEKRPRRQRVWEPEKHFHRRF
jgi:hypothetical protein